MHEQMRMALLISGLREHLHCELEAALPLYFRQIKWFGNFLILNVACN